MLAKLGIFGPVVPVMFLNRPILFLTTSISKEFLLGSWNIHIFEQFKFPKNYSCQVWIWRKICEKCNIPLYNITTQQKYAQKYKLKIVMNGIYASLHISQMSIYVQACEIIRYLGLINDFIKVISYYWVIECKLIWFRSNSRVCSYPQSMTGDKMLKH